VPAGDADPAFRERLAEEQARSRALAARCDELARALKESEDRAAMLLADTSALRNEVAALEASLVPAPQDEAEGAPDLAGRTLLYVGGRPKLVDQLRLFTAGHGGELLSHDGGVEDRTGLLPGLISRADIVFFPVDCVSHLAVEQVKRVCRQLGKPFAPLRSASLASFIAAVAVKAA
jgi:hypothetical protein